MTGRTGVLVVSFGGPTKPEEIRPFLDVVLKGRPIPPDRLEAVVQHYHDIGGSSPLNALTVAQAEALAAELARRGVPLPVAVGMRNWHPFLKDALQELSAKGVTRVIALVLAPHRGEASLGRYVDTIREASAALGPRAPAIAYPGPWYDAPGFIDALAGRVREALAGLPEAVRSRADWVFTAHSVPTRSGGVATYRADLDRTGELLAARFGGHAWFRAWQSRSGGPHEPWLEPDIGEVLKHRAAAGAKAVLVVPYGFVADHVEVLYDLDHQAAGIARGLGLPMARAGTVGDHPAFIGALADEVLRLR